MPTVLMQRDANHNLEVIFEQEIDFFVNHQNQKYLEQRQQTTHTKKDFKYVFVPFFYFTDTC